MTSYGRVEMKEDRAGMKIVDVCPQCLVTKDKRPGMDIVDECL